MALKIIQFTTTENLIFILLETGELFMKSLTTPDNIWEEVDPPILAGNNKNVRLKGDKRPPRT